MTAANLVTVAVAAKRTGVPERTIRAWCKPTTDRPALLNKSGHFVSLADVERVRDEAGYQPRPREKTTRRPMRAQEFADRVGRTLSTVYGWRKDGTITEYSERECRRMLRSLEAKAQGGYGLEEQARAHQAAVERGENPSDVAGPENSATLGELRREKLLALRRENQVAAGQLYEADKAEAVVRRIAQVYRESVDRLAVEVPRLVAAEFDRAGIVLDPHLRASIAQAVQTATLAAGPHVEGALAALAEK